MRTCYPFLTAAMLFAATFLQGQTPVVTEPATTASSTDTGEPAPDPNWKAEPTAWRGVAFGAPLSEAIQGWKLKESDCKVLSGTQGCSAALDLRSDLVLTTILIFDDDTRFVSVYFGVPADDWSFVRDVLIERYGPPTARKVAPVQNRMGATFENEEMVWSGQQVLISLDKYSDTLSKGSFSLVTRADAKKKNTAADDAKINAARKF